MNLLKQMIKEEWRMHSTLFKGRSFAAFPFTVLAFTFAASYAVVNFSTLSADVLFDAANYLGLFIGLSVGTLGFSNRDALKNVLGPTNFLVYSSRTLPISERKLLSVFLLKDLIYYTVFFLLPVSVGVLAATGLQTVTVVLYVPGFFAAGIVSAVILARLSLFLPSMDLKLGFLPALQRKSLLDVFRSTGGIVKILFSLGILTGFYWTAVLYFPFARPLLGNPLLSYSVLLGTVSLTIYNWLNRFDAVEDYLYLPVDEKILLDAKIQSFFKLSVPLTVVLLLISYAFYPANLLLGLIAAFSTQLYTAGIAAKLTGLEPNSRLFDTTVFLKYLVANSLFVLPLLLVSIIYTAEMLPVFIGLCGLTAFAGYYLAKK